MKRVSFLILWIVFSLQAQSPPDWKPISQIPEAYTIYDIYQLPWDTNIIFTLGHDRYWAWHAALWKSIDGGATWQYKFYQGSDWDKFLEMEVDKATYTIWIMGDLSDRTEESNVYYSLDNGESWEAIPNPASKDSIGVPRAIEMVNSKLYYGTIHAGSSKIPLLRYNAQNSDPAQWKWETVTTFQNANGVTEFLTVNSNLYIFVRNSSSTATLVYKLNTSNDNLTYLSTIPLSYAPASYYKNSNLYVGGDSSGTPQLYKSPDGVHWTKIGEWDKNSSTYNRIEDIDFVNDTLFVSFYTSTSSGYLIYKTTDDGSTWHPTYTPRGASTVKCLAQVNNKLWCGTGDTYGDVFEATWNVAKGGQFIFGPTYVFRAKNRGSDIYFTTNYDNGEIYKITAGTTVSKWKTFSDATMAFDIIWDADTIYVGTDASNSIKKSTDGGSSWKNTFQPRGVSNVLSFLIGTDVFLTGTAYYGDVFKGHYQYSTGGEFLFGPTYVFNARTRPDGLYFTTNYANGEIYKIDASGSPAIWKNFSDASVAWDIEWYEDTILVSLDSDNLIKRSTDNGNTWEDGFKPRGASSVLSIQYTSDNELYLGTAYYGDVFKGTYRYQTGGNYIYGPTYVYDVEFCGTNGYFACNYDNGEIWKTEDGGNTWSNLTSYLQPWKSAFSIVVFEDNIYVGTDYNGDVYKSTDNGASWVATKDLQNASYVFSLLLSTESKRNRLFAGTGMYGDVFLSDREVMTLSAPDIIPEPKFTRGTTNTIYCRDNGSDGYQFEAAHDSLFQSIVERSPVVTDTFYTFQNLQDGTKYYYRAYGRTCNYSSLPSTVTASTQDALPPQFFDETPQNKTWIASAKPTIEIFYKDAVGLDTNSVTLKIDKQPVSGLQFTDSTISYTPQNDLGEGSHQVEIYAQDLLGQGSTYQWEFKIDVTPPPPITLIEPADDTLLNTSSVTFRWTKITDIPAGLKYYKLIFSPDSTLHNNATEVITLDTLYVAVLTDTVFYWQVTAEDSAGNISRSLVRKVEVDSHAPNVPKLQYPINNIWLSSTRVQFQWNAVQKQSGKQAVSASMWNIEMDGKKHREIEAPTQIFATPVSYIIRIVSDTALVKQDTVENTRYELFIPYQGQYYWKVRAFDQAGNYSNWSALETFGIDYTQPEIDSLTKWADVTMFFGPFNIQVFATDAVSGVDSARLFYRVDQEDWQSVAMTKRSDGFMGAIPVVDSSYHTIEYYAEVKDYARNSIVSDTIQFKTFYVTGIQNTDTEIPKRFEIKKLWPNPTNGQFVLKISIPATQTVTLAVYNVLGQKIWEAKKQFTAGFHTVQIPANFSSGLYYISIQSDREKDVVTGIVVK